MKISHFSYKLDNTWNNFMYTGTILKNLREENGYTLLELQEQIGITESLLSKIESGNRLPTDELLHKFSEIYNIDISELIKQRDSDKLLYEASSLSYPEETILMLKEKIDSKGNYLTKNSNIIGSTIPLESRRYIGSKAKLINWIFEIIEKETVNVKTAVDIFTGTGIVAKRMLKLYDKVIVNDTLHSNHYIYEAFFSPTSWDKQKILEKIDFYNSLDANNINENYFSENFGNKYFENDLAKKIGYIRQDIEISRGSLTEKEYAILLTTLIYNIDKHANTVGHFEAYIKKPIKKADFHIRLIDVQEYNNIEIFQKDSNELAREITSDLVYIDPPYNSRQYCRFYHVYETLVKWDKPILSGVAMKPPVENMSKYCTTAAPSAFADLIENLNTKYLVVSYNNTYNSKSGSSKNKISLEEIETILKKKGETKVFYKDYRFFNTGKTSLDNHQELLFITKVKK